MSEKEELDLSKITLEDIEVMISILKRFVGLSREVQRTLRQLRPVSASYGYGGDIMKFILSETFRQRYRAMEEMEDTELTEDELKLIEKLRKKKAKEVKTEVSR